MHDTTIPEKTISHTPGPWHLRVDRPAIPNSSARWFVQDNANRLVLAETKALPPRLTAEAEANARLIAAAPDLLDALTAIVVAYDGPTVDAATAVSSRIQAARMAIVKAIGTLLLLLCFTHSAQAQSRPFTAALSTYLIAAAADLGTTEYQLGHGAREVLLGAGTSPTTLGVTKIALASVLASETHWLAAHRHPKVACWILILGSGLESAAAIHNARVNR